ncbi:MAG TPA: TadE/TadG family type IV pilus assembly protein [Actinomycetota bacterium]|jgi:Flp pilus assembly protein TadG
MTGLRSRLTACTGSAGRRLRGFVRGLTDRSGAAAVEFGVAAPVFLLFVFGTVEFSRVMWTDHELQYVADKASRFVMINPAATTEQIQAYAESKLMVLDPADVTFTVSQEVVNGVTFVTVTASCPFAAIVSFVPIESITLTGKSRMPLFS